MLFEELRDVCEKEDTYVALFDDADIYFEEEPLEKYNGRDSLTHKFDECKVTGIIPGSIGTYDNPKHYIFVHLAHEDVVDIKREIHRSMYEVRRAQVYATGNRWAIENWEATH